MVLPRDSLLTAGSRDDLSRMTAQTGHRTRLSLPDPRDSRPRQVEAAQDELTMMESKGPSAQTRAPSLRNSSSRAAILTGDGGMYHPTPAGFRARHLPRRRNFSCASPTLATRVADMTGVVYSRAKEGKGQRLRADQRPGTPFSFNDCPSDVRGALPSKSQSHPLRDAAARVREVARGWAQGRVEQREGAMGLDGIGKEGGSKQHQEQDRTDRTATTGARWQSFTRKASQSAERRPTLAMIPKQARRMVLRSAAPARRQRALKLLAQRGSGRHLGPRRCSLP